MLLLYPDADHHCQGPYDTAEIGKGYCPKVRKWFWVGRDNTEYMAIVHTEPWSLQRRANNMPVIKVFPPCVNLFYFPPAPSSDLRRSIKYNHMHICIAVNLCKDNCDGTTRHSWNVTAQILE